jgi:hypothetical protein
VQQPHNPDNYYPVLVNFMDPNIEEVSEIVMSGDINRKKEILNDNNLKMKNIVKIDKKGGIVKEDLKMMRILWGVSNSK